MVVLPVAVPGSALPLQPLPHGFPDAPFPAAEHAAGVGAGDSNDKVLTPVAEKTETPDEKGLMQRRLQKSDELIKQLKHIIKSQHGKIEELRAKLDDEVPKGHELASFGVQSLMSMEMEREFLRTKDANDQLSKQVGRLKAEATKLKAESESLRKVNRRYKAMLEQASGPQGIGWMDGGAREEKEKPSKSDDEDDEGNDSDSQPGDVSPGGQGRSTVYTAPSRTTRFASIDEDRRSIQVDGVEKSPSPEKKIERMPGVKLSRMVAMIPSFWNSQEVTGPRSVILALLDMTSRLLNEGDKERKAVVTVYIMDPWLCATAFEPKENPSLFYLQGKVTMQALQNDGSGGRAEFPRFSDLASLPYRSKSAVAIGIYTPTRRCLGVLQAIMQADDRIEDNRFQKTLLGRPTVVGAGSKASPRIFGGRPTVVPGGRPTVAGGARATIVPGARVTPRTTVAPGARMRTSDAAEPQEVTLPPEEMPSFSDNHQLSLTLVCNVAGGVLQQHEEFARCRRSRERVYDCMQITASVNRVKTLADFEQKVKHTLGKFFRVSLVRVLFYDETTRELLVSSSQNASRGGGANKKKGRKKGCQTFGLEKGVVAATAKSGLKGQASVTRIDRISQNPYLEPSIDGVEILGASRVADASMLVGSMLFEQEDGQSKLIGVVQLIERVRQRGNDYATMQAAVEEAGADGRFTEEEEALFQTILQICAVSAWRTFRAQMVQSQEGGGSAMTLAQMLSG